MVFDVLTLNLLTVTLDRSQSPSRKIWSFNIWLKDTQNYTAVSRGFIDLALFYGVMETLWRTPGHQFGAIQPPPIKLFTILILSLWRMRECFSSLGIILSIILEIKKVKLWQGLNYHALFESSIQSNDDILIEPW